MRATRDPKERLRVIGIMELRLGNDINVNVINALLDILDEEFDGAIKKRLNKTCLYVVSDQDDGIVKDIIVKLQEKEMSQFIKMFTEPEFENKEIVFCISDENDKIDSIVAKINVEDGNGYKTISAVHFLERMLRIFQNKKMINILTQHEESMIVEKIIYDIPGVVQNSKVVTMTRAGNEKMEDNIQRASRLYI